MRFLRQIGVFWTGILLVIVLVSLALLGARFVFLPLLSATPAVVSVSPPDGSRDVSPRTAIIIQFRSPMNPASVERALQIEPATDVTYAWNADRTILTVTPVVALQSGVRYRVTLTQAALSRYFRSLEQPFTFVFETAPPAAVTAVWPRDGSVNVPLDTPVSIRFSRPMVVPGALAQPQPLAALRIDPPHVGRAIWLDPVTLLVRPDQPFRPGVRYTFSLLPDLADQQGIPLGRTYSWSFTTLASAVRSVSPPPNARQVNPNEPLRIVLSQPVDLQALNVALSVTPPVTGVLDSALLPDGTQVITYTPMVAWQSGTTYTISIPALQADGTPLLSQPYRWSFITAPKPALIGRFPGEGQLLPPGRSVRLIFSTPVDADTLRAHLRIEPFVDNLRVIANDSEARIDAQFQAATLYTITVLSSLADRAGVPLERDYQVRFFTAPAAPSLVLPEVERRVIRTLPDRPVALLVRRTNVSELQLSLYQLDEVTLLRALSFNDTEWATFEPARYGLSLLRSWSQPLVDPLNTVIEEQVTVTLDDGSLLQPGIYFVRIRTPERAGASAILIVSRTALSLQVVGQRAIVWMTDIVSTTVIPDAPVALYRQGSLIDVGRTDDRGVWTADVSGVNPRDLIAVSSDLSTFASPGTLLQNPVSPRLRVILATDRTVYPPGAQVSIRGFVRRVGVQSFDPPSPGEMLYLEIRDPSGRSVRRSVTLDGAGFFETTLPLSPEAQPGVYRILAPQDDGSTLTFHVHDPAPPLHVAVVQTTQSPTTTLVVSVRTPEDLPVAGASVAWTIDREPLPPLTMSNAVSGMPTPQPSVSGTGSTDGDGLLTIALPATFSGSHHRYRFRAQVVEPYGPEVTVDRLIDAPPVPLVGLYAPSSIVRAGTSANVEVVTLHGDRSLAAQRVQVEATLLNNNTPDHSVLSPAEQQVLSRTVVTNSDGQATLALPLSAPGTYRVRASLVGIDPAPPPADIILRAYQPGFTGWSERSDGVALLTDRAQYQPGDTALILPIEPLPDGPLLLTLLRASGEVREELRTVRAGEPVTLTLTADDAPGVRVMLASASRDFAQRLLQADLSVGATPPVLPISLLTDEQEYAPGATAVLTLTVTDMNGDPAVADVFVRVTAEAGMAQKTIVWRTARTDGSGVLRINVPLPQAPGMVPVRVWVVGARGIGEVETRLIVSQPVVAQIVAPPFARAGDRIDAAIRLAAPAASSQKADVTLRFPDGTAAVQVVTIPAEGAASIPFPLRASAAATLDAQVTITTGATFSETLRRTLPVLQSATAIISAGGALVTDQFETTIPLPGNDQAAWGWLDVAVAPSLEALVRDRVHTYAASPHRRALDDAAIILMAASLADARQDVQQAINHLAALQEADGGWAWRTGGRTNPVMLALVLEALADAKEGSFALPEESLERAVNLAIRFARNPDVPLGTRICLNYALVRLDTAELSFAQEWDDSALDVYGLTCRLLMLPPEQARIDPAVPRLIRLAQRANGQAWWAAPAGNSFPYDDTATTAMAGMALHHASPRHPLVLDAVRWLIPRLTPSGWGDAYTTARTVQLLRAMLPAGTPATIGLALNNAPVMLPDAPGAMVRLIPLPINDLRPSNTLIITSDGALALVTWQVLHLADTPRWAEGSALLREYLDPHTGTPLDPARLQPGQLVQVRLTLVIHQERRFVTVRDWLPAGFIFIDARDHSFFDRIDTSHDRVEYSAEHVMPGIYQHTFLVRAVVPGSYAAPPPELILPGDHTFAGVATTTRVRITAP